MDWDDIQDYGMSTPMCKDEMGVLGAFMSLPSSIDAVGDLSTIISKTKCPAAPWATTATLQKTIQRGTPKQDDIIKHVVETSSGEVKSVACCVSDRTIKSCLERIKKKYGAPNVVYIEDQKVIHVSRTFKHDYQEYQIRIFSINYGDVVFFIDLGGIYIMPKWDFIQVLAMLRELPAGGLLGDESSRQT